MRAKLSVALQEAAPSTLLVFGWRRESRGQRWQAGQAQQHSSAVAPALLELGVQKPVRHSNTLPSTIPT